ncbi:hypothetical protein VNO77_29917 [Canavalia gladiata]|uniref:Uncharacterized protein n=1 Tax=Canavalia gladiata TaxID=3824 RepID=A0AAN9KQJ3_CANGL
MSLSLHSPLSPHPSNSTVEPSLVEIWGAREVRVLHWKWFWMMLRGVFNFGWAGGGWGWAGYEIACFSDSRSMENVHG